MADGCVVIMAPAGFESSFRNNKIATSLGIWTERDGRGAAFDSNTEFMLPDGSAFGPYAAWVAWGRIRKLTPKQKRKFARLCPDFIIELMSPSDRMMQAQHKMQLWIDNGVSLGWLIDPDRRTVTIYRPGVEPEVLVSPEQIAGVSPVAGFILDLKIFGRVYSLKAFPLFTPGRA